MNQRYLNPEKFQESITKELNVVSNRVRNLIGDANWGDEGRYKEAVLKNVIRRFLPSNLSIGSGFIVRSRDSSNNISISKQIDIIIYENTIPVLFSEGDLIITTNENVKAIIEVKTKIYNNQFEKILNTTIENAKFMEDFNKFNGVFSFEPETEDLDLQINKIKEVLKILGEDGKYINHISIGPYIFIKYWKKDENMCNNYNSHFGCYGIYKFRNNNESKQLSFSYFISNLLYLLTNKRLNKRLWYLFPIKGGKEQYRFETVFLKE
ncbi:hypothetical protein KAU33_13185 [Candidatus Dependentiae bacterium]|nr:hypothetical protein [Candidatus Dependentiae bacterium]